ncbi:MAG: glycosyltransferase [Thermoleophilia bacterium]
MTGSAEKLKVGLVSPYSWSSQWGVNRHVRGIAACLTQAGHKVAIIAPAEERELARAARREARAARRAARKPAAGQENAKPVSHRSVAPEGVRIHRIPGTFRVPYSESLANLALPLEVTDQLDALLSREKFDILHLHEPYPPSLSFTALRLARCPTLATFHTAGERFLGFQLMRPVVERFLARLDGRVCTSQNTRRAVSGYFPGSYRVIGPGVDTVRFFPPGGERDDESPLILFAAWNDPRRSQALLLRAMRLLPEDIPPFRLAIVGGEEQGWRANLIVPRRLRARVSFGGRIAPEQLADAYREAGALCAPYATMGLAGAVLEAMACGCPVVVPGEGGIRELVGDGAEGVLLDHPYSYNLAAGLVDLLRDSRLKRSLGSAAARKAQRYSWEKTAARLERAYLSAHRRRRRPAAAAKAMAGQEDGRVILADLHMHTSYSGDCATTPEELLAACQECGLEAIAVTDHNTIEGARETALLAPRHMHVIIGEEVKTIEGEIIGLYLTEEIPRGLSLEETIRLIREQQGLVYVPHPFDPLHLTPSYQLLAKNAADIDIIEVYNPRITFTSFNEKARRLARKYDIPGGAGSDCHVPQGVGTAMLNLRKFSGPRELLTSLRGADIIRSSKSPIYLHSLKLLKNTRGAMAGKP